MILAVRIGTDDVRYHHLDVAVAAESTCFSMSIWWPSCSVGLWHLLFLTLTHVGQQGCTGKHILLTCSVGEAVQ